MEMDVGIRIGHRDSCDFLSRFKFLKRCDCNFTLKEKSHHDSCDCVVLIVIEVERATEARAIDLYDWRADENLEGFSWIRKSKFFS